jgi:hypothetical protein
MAETDPFTQSYRGIWTLLEARQAFKDLVPVGNRIKYDSDTTRMPEKRETNTADLPEVRVMPMGGVYNLTVSSSHTRLVKRYQVQVATGDLRVQQYLHTLEIAVIAAMLHWPGTFLPMTWKTHRFVTKLEMGDAPEGRRITDIESNIQGWATMLSVSVTMHIPNDDLLAVE